MTPEGNACFGAWLDSKDFSSILHSNDPDGQVALLHSTFEEGMDGFFEWKMRNKKSSEPSWMADWIRDIISTRRKVYRKKWRKTD